MIPPHSQADDLQSLWLKDNAKPRTKDYSIMLRIAQEKQRSLEEFLHGEDTANYMLALCIAPLTAVFIWLRPIPMMQLGNLILTLTLIAGAVATWVNQRRARPLLKIDLSVREYQTQMLRLYDRQIRFSKGLKYWYVIPLFVGISLIGYPVLRHLHVPQPLSILLILAASAAFEYSVWRIYDVKRATDLQRRKDEMKDVLNDMDRVP
jgi:hypothetical protein